MRVKLGLVQNYFGRRDDKSEYEGGTLMQGGPYNWTKVDTDKIYTQMIYI